MATISIEERAARLGHASEVMGWLAKGKKLQAKHLHLGKWESFGLEKPKLAGIVKNIMSGVWTYRIEPSPGPAEAVEKVRVDTNGDLVVWLDPPFKAGDKVRVTRLESGVTDD